MDGPGDYHTEWSKSDRERQIWYRFHMESKKMMQMNLFTKQKQTHRHRKQTYGYQRGKMGGKDKLGVWDWQVHSTIFKINNQQGPTI